MAGIDKTYVSSSKDYFDFIEWAKEKKFTCPNGIILSPLDYVYEQDPETIDERIKEYGRITLMNTPVSMDYFLIKYCPLTFVQDRLREVYPESFIEDINKGISCFDNYRRNFGTKVKCIQESYYGPKDAKKIDITKPEKSLDQCILWQTWNARKKLT